MNKNLDLHGTSGNWNDESKRNIQNGWLTEVLSGTAIEKRTEKGKGGD